MSYSGYQSTLGGDSHQEYLCLVNSIANNIQNISQIIFSLKWMVKKLGTTEDNESHRLQLHQVQVYTNKLIRGTNNQLKQLAQWPQSANTPEQRKRRMKRKRFVAQFQDALRNVHEIQETAVEKEKACINKISANFVLTTDSFDENLGIELCVVGGATPAAQPQEMLQTEDDRDLKLLEYHQEAIKMIESDMKEVNIIFNELATMIHDQSRAINSTEFNVTVASTKVNEGTKLITRANDSQRRATHKKILLLIIIIIICIILSVVWITSI